MVVAAANYARTIAVTGRIVRRVLLLLLLASCTFGPQALAQRGSATATPRPPSDSSAGAVVERLNIAVVGDSLADGIWGGLYRFLVRDKRHIVTRATRNSVGFAGGDLMDLLDLASQAGRSDGVVMMIGANDRRSLFVDGRPVALLGTPAWREHYRTRAANFMARLEREGVPLAWILPPVVRAADADADYRMITDLIREAAGDRPHVWFIDARPLTADPAGQYRSHYKDLGGRMQLMRADDGIHFTPPGYEILAINALALLRQRVPRFAEVAELPSPAGSITK